VRSRREPTLKEFNERRHPMTSVFLASAFGEVVLVVAAAVIFLAMILAALAVIIWFVAGFISATHQYPAAHH
jgi:fatty acid desaturase